MSFLSASILRVRLACGRLSALFSSLIMESSLQLVLGTCPNSATATTDVLRLAQSKLWLSLLVSALMLLLPVIQLTAGGLQAELASYSRRENSPWPAWRMHSHRPYYGRHITSQNSLYSRYGNCCDYMAMDGQWHAVNAQQGHVQVMAPDGTTLAACSQSGASRL